MSVLGISEELIEETQILAEIDRRKREDEAFAAKQEELRKHQCPDCGAHLRIESSGDLPDDVKLRFVKHAV